MNRILSGALIVALAACGGGSSTPTPPVTTPAQSVRTVLTMVPFDIRAGATTFKSVVSLRGSSNLFLLRVDVLKRGFVEIEATIDGIDTNVLTVVAAGRS